MADDTGDEDDDGIMLVIIMTMVADADTMAC